MHCLKEWNVTGNPQSPARGSQRPPLRRARATRTAQTLFFLIIALGGLSGCGALEAMEGSVQQVWARFQIQKDELSPVRASGTIQAQEVRIASEFGGRIDAVHVQTGMTVQVGDSLVALDATSLADRLAETEAQVVAAQADLAALLAELPKEEMEVAQAALSMAVAEWQGAQLALENARLELQNPQALDAQIIDARTQMHLAEQAAILAEAELARERLLAQQKKKDTKYCSWTRPL